MGIYHRSVINYSYHLMAKFEKINQSETIGIKVGVENCGNV